MSTFAGIPGRSIDDIDRESMVVIGVPHGHDYPHRAAHCESSPAHIRDASSRLARQMGHLDFTFGQPIVYSIADVAIDIGDLPRIPDADQHDVTAATIRQIVGRGGVPIVLGGDHSIPVGTTRGYEGAEPFWIVQFDAHLDLRDDIEGIRDGLSSGIRRALELPWIAGVVQIGIRGLGSSRAEDLAATGDHRMIRVTGRDIRRSGLKTIVQAIPDALPRYYVTLDLDAFDPAIAPGVIAPAFGGLDYGFVLDTLEWLSERGTMIGMDIVELAPARDINDITAFLAARITLDAMSLRSRH